VGATSREFQIIPPEDSRSPIPHFPVKNRTFPLIIDPPEPIIAEFARIESPLFKNIETLLHANRKLVETRDKLLPRLISGKLPVEHLDIQFPPGMAEEVETGGS
jgi:hypothetical protein